MRVYSVLAAALCGFLITYTYGIGESPMELLPFTIYAFVSSVTPGPANVAILGMTSKLGWRKTLSYVAGIITGFFVVLVCSWLLYEGGMQLAGGAYLAVKIAGSLYLAWIAIDLWRHAMPQEGKIEDKAGFLKGVVIHPLSAKAWLLPLTSFATFSSNPTMRQGMLYISIFMATAIVSHLLWWALGELFHRSLPMRVLFVVNRVSAVVIVAMIVLMFVE
jgi:cysteine/O-acetylserine efflux protein